MTLAGLGMLSLVFSDAPVAIFYTQKREDCSCILCTDESGFFCDCKRCIILRVGRCWP
jgi:hypothetical protein